ncbi:MAG: hypothetical protein AB7E77_12960, partial [Desulfobulbus sp.]
MKKKIVSKYSSFCRHLLLLAGFLALTVAQPFSADAATTKYSLEFTDNTLGVVGSGSFLWDSDTETMTDLNWNFSGKVGAVLDTSLVGEYHSYDPLAATYGELYYRYLADSSAYFNTQQNPLSVSNGLMPSNVTGDDFGFISFGAERGPSDPTNLFYNYNATYRFLDRDWNLVSEGYVSAAPVPVPTSAAL